MHKPTFCLIASGFCKCVSCLIFDTPKIKTLRLTNDKPWRNPRKIESVLLFTSTRMRKKSRNTLHLKVKHSYFNSWQPAHVVKTHTCVQCQSVPTDFNCMFHFSLFYNTCSCLLTRVKDFSACSLEGAFVSAHFNGFSFCS